MTPAAAACFVTNAGGNSVAIVDASRANALRRVGAIDVSAWGSPNSVAARDGLVAVAVGASNKTLRGHVVFYRTDGKLLGAVQVGALPDMITFTRDGRYLLVANEGEPDGYGPTFTDPEGTISIIEVPAPEQEVVAARRCAPSTSPPGMARKPRCARRASASSDPTPAPRRISNPSTSPSRMTRAPHG